MEWDVVFDEARDAAIVTTRGVFNDMDHARLVADVVSRPQWHPGHRVLFDHRALDFGDAAYVHMLAARENHVAYDERIGAARSAILMKSLADFRRGRQFEQLVDGVVSADLAVFIDEAAAWHWLTREPS